MNWRKNLCAFLIIAMLVFFSVVNSSALVAGDADEDGVVRLADALLVMRYIVATQALTPSQLYACDVAGGEGTLPAPNGDCDIIDAVLILNKAYGLIVY